LLWIAERWRDYELLDAGDGERLERWGRWILRRPDPHVIWPAIVGGPLWRKAHAHYHRSPEGGGQWEFLERVPERWELNYDRLRFYVRLMGFKHTGLFPEQAANWDWLMDKIDAAPETVRVLNLFAYTGGATVAAAAAGAEVVHVDAAKGMVAMAKENLALSGLGDRSVRFIVDDVLKFVAREERRGRQYHGIIMDPPSFGRGPGGEVWKAEDELFNLVKACRRILAPRPLFLLLNSYTNGIGPLALGNILAFHLKRDYGGRVDFAEVGLPVAGTEIALPCGNCARWESAG
jgi:23S rRNA (cytosine1962-C5)-methyltransferase